MINIWINHTRLMMRKLGVLLMVVMFIGCTEVTDQNEHLKVDDLPEEEKVESVETVTQEVITYELENDLVIYKVTADKRELAYQSKKPLHQLTTVDNKAYFLKSGDLFSLSADQDYPEKVLDYASIRDKNFPVPTEINEYFMYDGFIYYMLTFDIYPYIMRADMDGLNRTKIFTWYDDHYMTDIISIEGDYIHYTYKDIFNLEAVDVKGKINRDGSDLRANGLFMDFLDD